MFENIITDCGQEIIDNEYKKWLEKELEKVDKKICKHFMVTYIPNLDRYKCNKCRAIGFFSNNKFIISEIIKPIKGTITFKIEASNQSQIDWVRDYMMNHMESELCNIDNFHQLTEGKIKVKIREE